MMEKWYKTKYEGYQVSNFGCAKSPWGEVGHTDKITGYRRVLICASIHPSGKQTPVMLHSLLLESSGSPRPEGMVCRHLNGDKLDNRLVNLEWGTPQDNTHDRKKHGTWPEGEKNSNAKLNNLKVQGIRYMSENGWPAHKIAEHFHIAKITVDRIRWGKAWSHV